MQKWEAMGGIDGDGCECVWSSSCRLRDFACPAQQLKPRPSEALNTVNNF